MVRKVSFAHRQFTYYKLNLRSSFINFIKPCNPSNSGTWRVSFFISVVLSSLQKFIKIAKIRAKILSVSAWVVLFQKRWTSVNTGFVGFVTNFFKWMCEQIFDDFFELFVEIILNIQFLEFLANRYQAYRFWQNNSENHFLILFLQSYRHCIFQ